MQYRATIERESARGPYNVSFADCPGCLTFGKTAAAALENAHEALEGWLEAHLISGTVPPAPKAKRGTPIDVRWRLAIVVQLRQRRAELGLTQAQLAKRAKLTQQQIAKLENPDENPTLATLEKVTAALGARFELVAA